MSASTVKPYNVIVGLPLGGHVSAHALHQCENSIRNCTKRHEATLIHAAGSAGNFNDLLGRAFSAALNDGATHFARIDADIEVVDYQPWLDILIGELDWYDLDFIANVVPIKDDRGIVSCGIGRPNDKWHPELRFTTKDVSALPETFSAADVGHPDKYLLHNTGLFVMDLRKPLWFKADADGVLPAFFEFHERLVRRDNQIFHEMESEDWAFSRRLHEIGAKTMATKKIALRHHGEWPFQSNAVWGWEKDKQTTGTWSRPQEVPTNEPPKAIEA